MKKIYVILLLASLSLMSCKENERLVYSDKAGLYFPAAVNGDSIAYSFTMVKWDVDTLNLSVKLVGNISDEDRKFKVKVNSSSTAVEGVHYKVLANEYTLEKNKVYTNVPIYIYKTADLDDKIVSISLSVVEDNLFSVGYADKNVIRYFITNQLVKPSYWDMPLSLYFGEYSKAKHQVCVDLMGHDFPLTDTNLDVQYYMRAGRKAALYFALNEVNDENGNRIETWDPF